MTTPPPIPPGLVPIDTPFRPNCVQVRALWDAGVPGASEYDIYHAHDRGVRRWLFDGARLTPIEPTPEDLSAHIAEQTRRREQEDAADRAMGIPPESRYSWASMRARDAAERAGLPPEAP